MVIATRTSGMPAAVSVDCPISSAKSSKEMRRSARMSAIVSPGAEAQLGQKSRTLAMALFFYAQYFDPSYPTPVKIIFWGRRVAYMVGGKNEAPPLAEVDSHI